MGGQACVFYGATQFSKDVDLVILADDENFGRLHAALSELKADRIAVPTFDADILATGHAVHYRCRVPEASGLRIDVMTQLRNLPDFRALWERRTNFDESKFNLLCLPDLIQSSKTQMTKHWPVIELLGAIHYRENFQDPRPDWVEFWLLDLRTPETLLELTTRFPAETATLLPRRPLLTHAISGDLDTLRTELDAEVRREQAKDRAYWEPLKRELEAFRRAERGVD
jgi:hypothetical protein